jgi:PAS domain S-box-containing protein
MLDPGAAPAHDGAAFVQGGAMPNVRWLPPALVIAAAYYGTGVVALALRLEPGGISSIWLPHGVLLAALILAPVRHWALYLGLLLPVHLHLVSHFQGAVPLWIMLVQFAGNMGQAVLGAAVVRRLLGARPSLDDLPNMSRFLVLGLALPVMLISAVVAGGFAVGGWVDNFGLAWHRRTLAQVCGASMLSVVILETAAGRMAAVLASRRRRWEFGAVTLGVLTLVLPPLLGERGFASQQALLFAPLPLLLWTAVRFGPAGLSLNLLFVALASLGVTKAGYGPFVAVSPAENVLSLEAFLLSIGVPLLLLAALVAERDRSNQSVRASEERLRLALASGHMGAWDWDVRRQTATWSSECFSIIGLEPFSVEPSPRVWASRVHPDDLSRMERTMAEAIAERKEYRCEHRVIGAGGALRWVEARAQPIYDVAGECVRVMGLLVDITDRKRAEDANLRLNQASRLAVVGELTASIAHEIYQPLSAILCNADAAELLLQAGPGRLDHVRNILGEIRKDSMRASDTIRHTRDLLRKREPERTALDLHEVIAGVLQLVGREAERRQISLDAELCSKVPVVHGDKVHLEQALLNLMLNGLEAMADAPGPRRRLAVRTALTQDGVEIVVEDHGHGIPPETVPRLFESFFTTKRDGLGLGLSIVRSIVEAHGGRIWAANRPEGGAAFHFTLPAAAFA